MGGAVGSFEKSTVACIKLHDEEFATVISFLLAGSVACCLHYIVQLQSAHCGESLSLRFETSFGTKLEFMLLNF